MDLNIYGPVSNIDFYLSSFIDQSIASPSPFLTSEKYWI